MGDDGRERRGKYNNGREESGRVEQKEIIMGERGKWAEE